MSMVVTELRDFAGRKIMFNDLSKRAQRILGRKNLDKVRDALEDGALSIRNTIITGMRDSPPTGKLYRRGKKVHRASSPGNFPRVDSGGLVGSIGVDVRHSEVEVGSRITDPAYPIMLEKGTDKMKPRPWLERSFKSRQFKIHNSVMQILRKSAEEFTRGR